MISMIDYHIHTPLCNHAVGTMAEYADAAIRKGLGGICFLDHLILSGPGTRHSMGPDDIPGYMSEIQALKERLNGRLEVYAGLEIDFQPEEIGRIIDIVDQYPFDAIGSSVHFVNGINVASRREAVSLSSSSEQELVEAYFEKLDQMLDYDYYDIICHFDVVKKTGRDIPESVAPFIDRIIRKIASKGVAVELNTAGWDHPCQDLYPDLMTVRKMISYGIPLVYSSDAHRPEETGRFFRQATSLMTEIGNYRIASICEKS